MYLYQMMKVVNVLVMMNIYSWQIPRNAGDNRDWLPHLSRNIMELRMFCSYIKNDHAGIQLVGAPLTSKKFYAWCRSIILWFSLTTVWFTLLQVLLKNWLLREQTNWIEPNALIFYLGSFRNFWVGIQACLELYFGSSYTRKEN